MGCQPTKLIRPSERSAGYAVDNSQPENELNIQGSIDVDSAIIQRHDQEILGEIREDLNERPDMFVLNNVLMCTMFLKNYQEEMNEIFNKIDNSEERFVEPDIVMEKANQNIIYRPMHGPNKDFAEPLVTKRMYVPVNKFIDVYNSFDDTDDVESVSSNRYQVKMEKSKRKGFIKLKRINNTGSLRNSLKDVLMVPSSSTSGSSDTESSECTSNGTVPRENPQLIKDQNDEGSLQDCFVFRKVKKADININLEDMDHENLKDEDVYDIISYLPSRQFMKYFQSNIFKNSVAKELGLIQYEIDNAIVDENIPGKIFCNLQDNDGNSHPVEVLPCLTISWPESLTYDFLYRKPPVVDEDMFIWPTQDMLSQIRQLNCALVPKGYSKKRGEYPEGDLEWEIHFPLAERYMESFLRPEQIKCYLVLLALHKEYIEPVTKKQGLVPDHLRTFIFWESENDYDGWPEHRLGLKLIYILKHISHALHNRNLADYFVDKKNILKNVSRRHLEHANATIHNIIQSPVMLIIRALRNLRTTSGKFYPPLNFKELLNIMYKRDWDTANEFNNQDNISTSTTSLGQKPKYADPEQQLQYVKERERKKRLMKKKEKKVDAHGRRMSQDSIKDNWEYKKPLDPPQKIALLKLFIESYLDIAETSSRISTPKQTMFYLKQAWYLTKILEEENHVLGDLVKDLFSKINEKEDKCVGAMHEHIKLYGSLDVINNNKTEERYTESEADDKFDAENDLNKMVNVFNNISNRNDGGTHRQVRKAIINLRSLSRSFSTNYPISDNYKIENFR